MEGAEEALPVWGVEGDGVPQVPAQGWLATPSLLRKPTHSRTCLAIDWHRRPAGKPWV